MKNKLIVEFSEKLKTIVEDPKASETSQSIPANTSQSDHLDNNPTVRDTSIVDQFETEPTQAPSKVTLK